MDKRKQIEEILLTDYGCFDDFTVDKLCDLFRVEYALTPPKKELKESPKDYCEFCGTTPCKETSRPIYIED